MQCTQPTAFRLYRHYMEPLLAPIVSIGLSLLSMLPASAATLDRVREAGKLTLGYLADARPFSFQDGTGGPMGYSIALCQGVANEVKTELGRSDLAVDWVPVSIDDRFQAIEQGKVDLLCGAYAATLERRKAVAFSLPVFPSGIAALLRADASRPLQDVLAGRPASGPIWRASPARILQDKNFSVVRGTTAESWLSDRLRDFELSASVVPVESYDAGITRVLDRDTDVLFGQRAILAEAAAGSQSSSNLIVLDRLFTFEPVALVLARNDDDFRLVVDRFLSRQFKSGEFRDLYAKWFGAPDEGTLNFFRQTALPE